MSREGGASSSDGGQARRGPAETIDEGMPIRVRILPESSHGRITADSSVQPPFLAPMGLRRDDSHSFRR